MGGLVARAALAHRGEARISRAIQLGTPNRGAFVAVQALRGSYPLVRRLALLDLRHDAEDIARKVLTTFPGLCGLLPPAEACQGFDPFDAGQWPDGPKPAAEVLETAQREIARLPAPDERFALIAGHGQDTVIDLRSRRGKLEFGRSPAGDGTVLVQEMLGEGEGKELILGVKTDPQFGPVMMFGLGGILVEVVKIS